MTNETGKEAPISSQSQDTPDPLAAAESNSDLSEEIDIDDAIHTGNEKPTEANKDRDADDAVHKNYKPSTDAAHENDERDPDDAVHGN